MTTRDQVHKWFFYALGLVPIWVLDAFVLNRIAPFGVIPMLLPLAVAAVAAVIRAVQFHRQTGLELVAAAVPEAQEVRLAMAALSSITPSLKKAARAVHSETKTISCFWTNSAVNWWCEVRICHITQANTAAKI